MKNFTKSILIVLNSIKYFFLNFSISKKVNLNVPYVFGSFGNCGISSATMIANFYKADIIADEEYWETLKNPENYIEEVGWKHNFLKEYINTNSEHKAEVHSFKSMNFVINQLSKGKPVEVSISVPTPDNLSQEKVYEMMVEGEMIPHLAVCIGYDKDYIYMNDPRQIGIYAQNLAVPKSKFREIFTGNCIV